MGNCISAGPLHHEDNIWGEEQFVKGSRLFIGAPCEESQVPSNSPYPSLGLSQPRKKASPHPLSVPLANSGFPEACVGALPRRSSASTLSSPHQLHTQCQTSHMRRGSLPLCPSSVVPSPVTSPRGPKDSRGSPLLYTEFPRDSALSVSTSSPHSTMPLADTSLTPSHSLCTHPTAHTICPPAAPPNSAKFSPAKSPKSADFSRTLRRQPSKPFALSRPGSPPCLAPNLTAPITHQGPSTDAPVHAALQPAHTEAQQQLPYTLGAGKDVCRCEALGSGPTSSAMPCSPCSAQASPTSILPSPFAQQWLAKAEAEGEHGSGISGGDGCGGQLAEARDASDDKGQQCIVQTRSHRHAPRFFSSTVRHTSAGSYHWGLQSAQHSLCQQASHDMPSGGADNWASMHMAMAVAAELGENIPPSSMEVVAVIAEAEARASNACQPLSSGNTHPVNTFP
ncbi:hypothetical protein DUNSADRAFT_1757 [Dunaliella salina]|uniref:Encoded protein n=1 Tax=Dunaliella salina TaxID=3046 RepID=A0ABQ7FX31_DUNSA|nr:hypothetical protein DUNSADRAFT_1757 [Dunaliella salina]|eukprot:KAF5826914.1 hypothetical protein DUNSADRAFT_1757 [Dunaliella salina]